MTPRLPGTQRAFSAIRLPSAEPSEFSPAWKRFQAFPSTCQFRSGTESPAFHCGPQALRNPVGETVSCSENSRGARRPGAEPPRNGATRVPFTSPLRGFLRRLVAIPPGLRPASRRGAGRRCITQDSIWEPPQRVEVWDGCRRVSTVSSRTPLFFGSVELAKAYGNLAGTDLWFSPLRTAGYNILWQTGGPPFGEYWRSPCQAFRPGNTVVQAGLNQASRFHSESE